MKLDRFNRYGKFIDFDPDRKLWMESSNTDAQERPIGIGDLLDDSCVAVIVRNRELFLYVGQFEFDLGDEELKLQYVHNDDGTTLFSAANSINTAEVTYTSWWRVNVPGVAAFGSAADEDEDVCAYILFMANAEPRRRHLIEKYS